MKTLRDMEARAKNTTTIEGRTARSLVAILAGMVVAALIACATGGLRAEPSSTAPLEQLATGDGGTDDPPPDDPDSRPSPTLPLPPPAAAMVAAR